MIIHRTDLGNCILYRPEWRRPDERKRWQAQVMWIARERRYMLGFVYHLYKARWGAFPTGSAPEPIPPTDEVRAYVDEQIKAFHRSPEAKAKREAKKRGEMQA
jgi:hypothetical protein